MRISVIIPCYNEEKRIASTIQRISSYLKQEFDDYEIVVVENGSTDRTIEVLTSLSRHIPFRILKEELPGKGRAVKKGMLESNGDFKLFTDADNSTDISHVKDLLIETNNMNDVVISSRRLTGSHIAKKQPFFRSLLGNIFSRAVHVIVPLGIHDTQNGFKLFSKRASEFIFARQTIFGWAFDVEILAIAKIYCFSIAEVPITWTNDEQSKMNLKGMLGMLSDILLIRWRLSTRYYLK